MRLLQSILIWITNILRFLYQFRKAASIYIVAARDYYVIVRMIYILGHNNIPNSSVIHAWLALFFPSIQNWINLLLSRFGFSFLTQFRLSLWAAHSFPFFHPRFRLSRPVVPIRIFRPSPSTILTRVPALAALSRSIAC